MRQLKFQIPICLTKSLNSTAATQGHLVDPMSFFVLRVRLRNRNSVIFSQIFEAADCMLLTIWQVSNLLEQLSERNSFICRVFHWQIWKTQLFSFHSPLYFVVPCISFLEGFWNSDKSGPVPISILRSECTTLNSFLTSTPELHIIRILLHECSKQEKYCASKSKYLL